MAPAKTVNWKRTLEGGPYTEREGLMVWFFFPPVVWAEALALPSSSDVSLGKKTPPNIKFHHKVMNALGCESVTGEGTCKKQSFCHLLNPNKIWFAGLVCLLHTQHASQACKLMAFFLFSLSLTYSSVSFIHLTTSHSLLTPRKSVSYQLESNDWVILAIQ